MLPQGLFTALGVQGFRLDPRGAAPVAGGSINRCFRVRARDGEHFFLKTGPADALAMYEAESLGLAELRAAKAVRAPEPLLTGSVSDTAWLLLEFIEPGGSPARAGAALGERLAIQHRVTSANFGWSRDNHIGRTPQVNTPASDWVTFWRDHRLGAQLRLAADNGFAGDTAECGARVLESLPAFFDGYRPAPSLLHGDLWGGNWSATPEHEPVIFDPAVYFGDREADLAMTELFGGFPRAFLDAYRATWPLDTGYAVRRDLYNLYHVLNHLNLFGRAYLRQSLQLMDRLLAAVR